MRSTKEVCVNWRRLASINGSRFAGPYAFVVLPLLITPFVLTKMPIRSWCVADRTPAGWSAGAAHSLIARGDGHHRRNARCPICTTLRGLPALSSHLRLKRMRLRVARPRPQGREHIRCVYDAGGGLLTNRQRAPRWVLPRRL